MQPHALAVDLDRVGVDYRGDADDVAMCGCRDTTGRSREEQRREQASAAARTNNDIVWLPLLPSSHRGGLTRSRLDRGSSQGLCALQQIREG